MDDSSRVPKIAAQQPRTQLFLLFLLRTRKGWTQWREEVTVITRRQQGIAAAVTVRVMRILLVVEEFDLCKDLDARRTSITQQDALPFCTALSCYCCSSGGLSCNGHIVINIQKQQQQQLHGAGNSTFLVGVEMRRGNAAVGVKLAVRLGVQMAVLWKQKEHQIPLLLQLLLTRTRILWQLQKIMHHQ